MNFKKMTLRLTIILLAILTFACSEDDPGTTEQQEVTLTDVSPGELLAIINGSKTSANTINTEVTGSQMKMDISFPDNQILTIFINDLQATTYTFNSTSEDYAELATGTQTFSTKNESGAGTFEITNINNTGNTVTGTFNLKLFEEGNTEAIEFSSAAFSSISFTVHEENPNTFTATVNENSWSAEEITAKVNEQVNVLDIKGTTENDIDLSIYFPVDIEPGTYQFSGNGDYVGVVFPAGETIGTHYSESGELVITSHDTENKIIEGTFHLKATRTGDTQEYAITDGQFYFEGYY